MVIDKAHIIIMRKVKYFISVDMMGRKCVRLVGGKTDSIRTYARNPIRAIAMLINNDINIHMIDLDGCIHKRSTNIQLAKNASYIVSFYRNITIQLGGGIRTVRMINFFIRMSFDYLIVGTILYKKDCSFLLSNKYIAIALDYYREKVYIKGWLRSCYSLSSVSKMFSSLRDKRIIQTDIERDGRMMGVSNKIIFDKRNRYILSGGYSAYNANQDDDGIKSLYGYVIGQAFYKNRVRICYLRG
ncbi:HisA/HisF-related TIM barrel protein [Candidatus Vidania fulgoroideorum]